MNDHMLELEKEIEQSRAKLGTALGRLQNKLTFSSMVEEFLGGSGSNRTPLYDAFLATARRNPIPIALIATGIAMLAYKKAQNRSTGYETIESYEGSSSEDEVVESDVGELSSVSNPSASHPSLASRP